MGNEGSFGNANFSLDADAIKEIIRASIIQAIDADARERLISEAIQFLMTPQKKYAGAPNVAPITEVFNQAVHNATRDIIFEEFRENPEVKKAISDVVHPMVVKLCEGNYDGLPDAIGTAFAGWLAERKQYVE